MTVNLPVVNSYKHDIDNISSDLKRLIDGDILSKEWERSIYSTDASPYEIMPLCIVLPKSNEDVIKTVKYAYENRIPIIARGGGSGLAGQAIGAGIILDFSKYMNEIKKSINLPKTGDNGIINLGKYTFVKIWMLETRLLPEATNEVEK